MSSQTTGEAYDPYPESFALEFDRERTEAYFRAQFRQLWLWIGGAAGLCFGAPAVDLLLGGYDLGVWEILVRFAGGVGAGLLLSLLPDLIWSRKLATRHARRYSVSVEGSFLRLRVAATERGARCDQKLHFRSIVDYAVATTRAQRRFGVATLVMRTTAGGQPLRIVGLKESEKVRDLLAEIDASREWAVQPRPE